MKRKYLAVLGALIAVSGAFAANIWYANAGKADDLGSGTSPETARKHIQSLIDDPSVLAGDTIIVMPGRYDDGSTPDANGYSARVYVNKALTIKGMPGERDATFITGGRDTSSDSGIGSGATRAFSVNVANVTIEGLTICDGYGTGTGSTAYGGGVYFLNATDNWLIDCVVSNCAAYRGGALMRGIAIRCLFTENKSANVGEKTQPWGTVASSTTMLNSLVVRNPGTSCLFNSPGRVVGCTIADNSAGYYSYTTTVGTPQIYNSIITENAFNKFTTSSSYQAVLSNCLFTAGSTNYKKEDASHTCNTNASAYGFFAPALGDYCPTAVSGAVGIGDPALQAKIPVPAGREDELRYTDFNGNTIRQDVPMVAGAIQETAGVAAAFDSSSEWECESWDLSNWKTGSYGHYAHATNWPMMYKMRIKGKDRNSVVWYEDTIRGKMYIPDTNGYIGVILPPDSGTNIMITLRSVYKTLWVDGENGDNSYGGDDIGTESHPYKTINAAINAAPYGTGAATTRYSLIRVKRGTYTADEGAANVVHIPTGDSTWWYKRLRIQSEEGPEHTIIDGMDTVRCVNFQNPAAIQGFTVMRGYSADATEGSAFHAGAGIFTSYMTDCLITNHTQCSAVQRGCTTIRCRFVGNAGFQVVNGRSIGCAITCTSTAFEGGTGRAYFCTIDGQSTKGNSDFCYYGCIFKDMGTLSLSGQTLACFGHGTEIGGAGAAGCRSGNARFIGGGASSAYQLYSTSEAIGVVNMESFSNFWQYATLDFAGNTIYMKDDCITAGAWQHPSIWRDPGFYIILR